MSDNWADPVEEIVDLQHTLGRVFIVADDITEKGVANCKAIELYRALMEIRNLTASYCVDEDSNSEEDI